MKLGVFITRAFANLGFGEMLDFMKSRGLFISALSAHGNPLHPDMHIARKHHETFLQTIRLANQLGVPLVNGFSGVPGAPDGSLYPNFPVTPWPFDYEEIFQWQWKQKIIPYWREVGKYARQCNVKIGIEPHGGFSVHSPATLLKLRHEVGDVIGTNFDASHLWWQNIDPVEAVKILGYQGAIYQVSTKDMCISGTNSNYYGILDMQPFDQVQTRSWIFRTIGYGHDMKTWADIISALQQAGYSYAFNIEQDDPLMDSLEGFTKAADSLGKILIRTSP